MRNKMYNLKDLTRKLIELENSWVQIEGAPYSTKVTFQSEMGNFHLSWSNGGIFLMTEWGFSIISSGGKIIDKVWLTPQLLRKLAENLQYLKETLTKEVPKDLIDTIDRLK